jgi:hypothetical protein
MGQWGGGNPNATYMAGLGSYARNQGVYQQEQAQADSVNVDTMIKWNKALRARQAALNEDKQKETAKQRAQQGVRVEKTDLKDGTTLNNLLLQILDVDPGVVRSSRAQAPISAAAIREIPFESDSEAITICIDQMTGKAALPRLLMLPSYAEERNALQSAIKSALAEDTTGSVSIATRKRIDEAVSNFRSKFIKTSASFDAGYNEALDYFTTMASLSRLLNNPNVKAFLAKLDDKEHTVGELIVFMSVHNLRFGPASTDRQVEIYTRLVPILTAIRDASPTDRVAPSAPDRTGEALTSAAKNVFKGMSWNQLEAHGRSE